MSGAKVKKSDSWLVFIDTNILLDFYRLRGENAMKQLDALLKHKDSIITGEQVKMEYLKHRQAVVSETLRELKKPIDQSLPPILSEYHAARTMKGKISEAVKGYSKVKEKAEQIIKDPARHDEVYKKLNRLFSAKSALNLGRNHRERLALRSAARKRFMLGYPPRKKSDVSIGDAYNWEWIIKCAQNCSKNSHVLIVSRDGDFGSMVGGDAVLNDWLLSEFKERVSRKRKIELTTKLTLAMKRLDETVTKEEEEEEAKVISASSSSAGLFDLLERARIANEVISKRLAEMLETSAIDPGNKLAALQEVVDSMHTRIPNHNYLRILDDLSRVPLKKDDG